MTRKTYIPPAGSQEWRGEPADCICLTLGRKLHKTGDAGCAFIVTRETRAASEVRDMTRKAGRELTFDESEALGLDGTGRDGDPRFPYHDTDAPRDLCDICGHDADQHDRRAERDECEACEGACALRGSVIIAAIRSALPALPVRVDHSGGGCATMYIGASYIDPSGDVRYPLLVGPGWFGDDDTWFPTNDTVIGPDDDGESDPAEVRTIADVIAALDMLRP